MRPTPRAEVGAGLPLFGLLLLMAAQSERWRRAKVAEQKQREGCGLEFYICVLKLYILYYCT